MLKPTIQRQGQKYVDDPIYIDAKQVSIIESSVARAFGRRAQKRPLLVGHERVKLKWIKPDGTPK
jgi:hypothetical protein